MLCSARCENPSQKLNRHFAVLEAWGNLPGVCEVPLAERRGAEPALPVEFLWKAFSTILSLCLLLLPFLFHPKTRWILFLSPSIHLVLQATAVGWLAEQTLPARVKEEGVPSSQDFLLAPTKVAAEVLSLAGGQI